MDLFLTKIHINKIFHLEDFDIDLDSKEKKHLIITGKNGSGKTSLMNAIGDFLEMISVDPALNFMFIEQNLENQIQHLSRLNQNYDQNRNTIHQAETHRKYLENQYNKTFGKIIPEFSNLDGISKSVQLNDFTFSFYEANRKTKVIIPKNPEKPNLTPSNKIKDSKVGEFIRFLVDLKVQEALARNENQIKDANKIKDWFESFETLLGDVFEGLSTKLEFNFKDYSFVIKQEDKEFGFNHLSDGYSAIIDIVADLILKMQQSDSLTRAYEKQGIVLIDEIETHLHLSLQKTILPMLTRVFPNIQFIVTTHSPFVLNSIQNAVAYDLEKKLRIDDLTEYSYEALAEGYFGVSNDSSFLRSNLNRFKELSKKKELDSAEKIEFENLDKELDSLGDSLLSPKNIYGEYLQLKLKK